MVSSTPTQRVSQRVEAQHRHEDECAGEIPSQGSLQFRITTSASALVGMGTALNVCNEIACDCYVIDALAGLG